MKTCTKCQTAKEEREFNKQGKGLSPWCKGCFSVYHKERWKKDSKRLNKRQRELDAERKKEIELKVVEYFKTHHCIQCGESNILKLDFDHIKGKKSFNVAKGIWAAYSWTTIEKEIAKCQVLCANCHRVKTAYQLNTWKTKYT